MATACDNKRQQQGIKATRDDERMRKQTPIANDGADCSRRRAAAAVQRQPCNRSRAGVAVQALAAQPQPCNSSRAAAAVQPQACMHSVTRPASESPERVVEQARARTKHTQREEEQSSASDGEWRKEIDVWASTGAARDYEFRSGC